MTTVTRLAAGIITAFLATATAGRPAPSAAAATVTVSPGDRVDYVSPTAGNQFCTIGYVYTAPDFHTYAVTAGHCRNSDSGYARDTRTGLTGDFIRTVVEPPRSGGADYGLIDFGRDSVPSVFMGDTPYTDDHPQPQVGQSVCHTGVIQRPALRPNRRQPRAKTNI